MTKHMGPIVPLAVLMLFLAASVACSVGGLLPGLEAETPRREVVTSPEQAAEAERLLAEARTSGTLRMTEAQFTSFLIEQIDQQGADVPLEDLTVWFEPGEVVLRGRAREGALPVGGELILSGTLAVEEGQIRFAVVEARAAGVRLPGAVVNLLNDRIDATLARSNLQRAGVRSITVEEGVILIERE